VLKEAIMAQGAARPAVVDQPPTRREELDLLRALVVVGLVFFHTAVIFGAGEFPIKAATENRAATVFLAFGATWGMPLLFLIAGMGTWYSLRSRSPAAFARERLRRLAVPLLVGLLTLVPLQVWLGRRHAGDPSAFASFYARFWQVRPTLDFPFVITAAPDGVFETGHLWFLVCLLGFSLALLPGFAWLRRPAGTRLLERLGGLLTRPGGLLLPALPLAAVEVAVGSDTGHGGWNHASYALFLLYGFLAAADPRTGEALQQRWRPAAAVGLVLFLAAVAAAYGAADAGAEPFTDMDPRSMGFRLLKSVDGWLWVVAVLGLARARIGRRRSSPAQPPAHRAGPGSRLRRLGVYANDAVLPFYVLHETIIVAVAYLVLAWPIGAGAQYGLIALVSLAATLLLYDLGVRRSPLTRFLFGLKQPGGPAARTAHQVDDSDGSASTAARPLRT
jgi:surface polysaccharide O-acyltransferase-like enzyme